MGRFSDDIRKKLRGRYEEPEKKIEFACRNCLEMFTFEYRDIWLQENGDLAFEPEPECVRCGSTEDIVFSDYGQEKIEDMLFRGQIRKGKKS